MSQKSTEEREQEHSVTSVIEVNFDWQEETISTVFFSSGLLISKDTPSTVHLCREALQTMGLSHELSSDITVMYLTKEEESQYKYLFRTIVLRLYEERYDNVRIAL